MRGRKIWLHSLGCRTNQAELEAIASGLAEGGAIFSDTPNDCDAAVILTCSVTAMADKKSRQCVRMARREMPNGTIIACGCWAQRLSPDEAHALGIDFVVANGEKGKILGMLNSLRLTRFITESDPSELVLLENGSPAFGVIYNDIASEAGILPGEIHVNVGAIRHVEKNHGTQIRQLGYSNVVDFIFDVLRNYSEVRQGSDASLLLIVPQNERSLMSAIGLVEAVGAVYRVKNALVVRNRYLHNKKLLSARSATLATDSDIGPTLNPASPESSSEGDLVRSACRESNLMQNIALRGDDVKIWDSLPRLKNLTLRSRAFVKIQDGCDHFCAYCIVPFLRGAPVSRPFDDVFDEIASIAATACEEIILTGTNLGKYNSDGRKLEDIVREFAKFTKFTKLRLQFGSIEPFSLDEGLLKAISDLGENFVPPLHIPLQSGDDEVLRLMRRDYTSGQYLEKIAQVRAFLGDIPLSTDLLIGFPGESDAAFERSRAILREIGYSRIHVFPFSPREGTSAAKFLNQVPREIISARARIIRDENQTRD